MYQTAAKHQIMSETGILAERTMVVGVVLITSVCNRVKQSTYRDLSGLFTPRPIQLHAQFTFYTFPTYSFSSFHNPLACLPTCPFYLICLICLLLLLIYLFAWLHFSTNLSYVHPSLSPAYPSTCLTTSLLDWHHWDLSSGIRDTINRSS